MILCKYAHTRCDYADDNCYNSKVENCVWYKRFERRGLLEKLKEEKELKK